jgi:predicted small lipoprotein YifL
MLTPGMPMLRNCFLALLIALPLTACGNKGPLVLPDPDPAPAPAAQDKDKKPATPPPAAGTSASQH